jgi:hypothetical protein
MKKLLLILVLIGPVYSCKKDSLKKEQEILVGYWKWLYSKHTYGWCEGLSTKEDIINEEITGWNYSMNLRKNGCVEFFNNNKAVSKYRLVCDHFKKYENGNFEFVYLLNNDKDSKLAGYGFPGDSLVITQFPFKGEEVGCDEYLNYFIRE